MKKKLMNGCVAAFAVIVIGSMLAACMKTDVYDPDNGETELKPESEYFDFKTTTRVAFDVNYGITDRKALLEIFTEDPLTYSEDGNFSIDGEPAYQIFADRNGRFVGNVELPKAAERVYIVSPNWGAPLYVVAEVTDGKVTVDETAKEGNAVTRVVTNPQVIGRNEDKRVYSIVKWSGWNGEIDDVNMLTSTGSFNYFYSLQWTLNDHSLWRIPSLIDNSGLVRDTEHVNTTIRPSYVDASGTTVTVEDAELFLTFLYDNAGYKNTIGYYYYKTDEVPSAPAEVDKFIVIPNASVKYAWGGALKENTKFQLLYRDAGGNVSTKFPAGYTVGYFLIPDGYDSRKQNIDYSKGFVYSNKEWNTAYEGEQSRFISLAAKDGTVVYGVEDGSDKTYDDVLFSIDATPNGAIQDDIRPVMEDEDNETVTSVETSYSTYAYEDIWPHGGDYDLNDAIVEHKRVVTFDSDNYVQTVEDTFEPVQKADAADYANAFAVQYSAGQRGNISLPQGAVDETETSSVILFPDAVDAIGQTFTVTRRFNEGVLKKNNLITDLNPFIIAQYAEGADNRTEIHLPKQKATAKANAQQIGAEDDAYYINKNGKYPFAIMLPLPNSSDTSVHFTPAAERVSIDKEYPDFAKWVASGGTDYNDWYLYYKSSRDN